MISLDSLINKFSIFPTFKWIFTILKSLVMFPEKSGIQIASESIKPINTVCQDLICYALCSGFSFNDTLFFNATSKVTFPSETDEGF